MTPKRILILGASSDQLFAIRTAKAMGLQVIAADYNPDSIGFQHADVHTITSIRDESALMAFVDTYQREKGRIDGVMTMGADIPLVVAKVAYHLGTPSISEQSAIWASDKLAMKRRFKACGIPIPWFQEIHSYEELLRIIEQRGYPLVLKPNDRSGARGVFRMTSTVDVKACFETAKSLSFSGQLMVEQYLEGQQISTESFRWDDQIITPGFSDRNYEMLERFAPNIIENGGDIPSTLTPLQRLEMEQLIARIYEALEIRRGVLKGDLIWTPAGPQVIEIAARLSGGNFCAGLIPESTGVNLVEAVIDHAVGNIPDMTKLQDKWQRYARLRYFFVNPGTLRAIHGRDLVGNSDWVKILEFYKKPGDQITSPTTHGERLGCFLVTGNTRPEVEDRVRYLYSSISFAID